ncbi:MAG: hypothetical protein IAC06_05760 [Bacteroidetes bacterium]|uniref:Uncharacterized protein n=1 Tax=Candidatus Cryptobacteroides intestinavium TaxID=2840766 RepID=A0A9D9HIV4_9BACT|nr:hypothetical protein [Candidatus Cryptobacteroides intestinavium]
MWCFRSFTPPGGLVYGDRSQASSMVTGNVIMSTLSLSFVSEESEAGLLSS